MDNKFLNMQAFKRIIGEISAETLRKWIFSNREGSFKKKINKITYWIPNLNN